MSWGKNTTNKAVLQERGAVGFAAGGIDAIGDLLEGIEGDPERQHDVAERDRAAGQRIPVLHREAGIFEIADQHQIYCYADTQQQTGSRTVAGSQKVDPRTNGIIECDARQYQ
jgi:hypothetical protein